MYDFENNNVFKIIKYGSVATKTENCTFYTTLYKKINYHVIIIVFYEQHVV